MNRIKEVLEEKLDKSYNIANGYVQNRQQPMLEVLIHIAEIIDIDIKELIVSTKWKRN